MNTPPGAVEETATQLAKALSELQVREDEGYFGYKREVPASSVVTFAVVYHPERLVVSWPAEYGAEFSAAVSTIAQALRDEKRDPTFVEFMVRTGSKSFPNPMLTIRTITGISPRSSLCKPRTIILRACLSPFPRNRRLPQGCTNLCQLDRPW